MNPIRIFEIACGVLAVGALGLLIVNFLNNPVEAKRAELEAELLTLDGRATAGIGEEFLWPFSQWQSAIKGNPKVWDGLIEPPKAQAAPVKLATAPGWDTLLSGVKVLMRQQGQSPKIIYPGSASDGDYVPVGTTINGCVLDSFDRTTATFTHHWPPTNETRSHTVQRVLK